MKQKIGIFFGPLHRNRLLLVGLFGLHLLEYCQLCIVFLLPSAKNRNRMGGGGVSYGCPIYMIQQERALCFFFFG